MEHFGEFIDYDEGRDIDPREAFFEHALPCESCGKPCDERRVADWDPELMVGPCCYRYSEVETPDIPVCEALYELQMSAETVGQLMTLRSAHKATCSQCGMKVEPKREIVRESRRERAA